ncbi:major facilitator superfamily domain-containing protein 10 isoform X2 [Agrilus planipennis]|nr:major facilitator superfamily domain-containing protein 10 isoform X2 [Agrilus planipennis]
MALVGIAFSLGFIVGPLIGAGFAVWGKNKANDWFIYPALFAFLLSISDLMFFAYAFRETLPKEKRAANIWTSLQGARGLVDLRQLFQFKAINLKPFEHRQLQQLGIIYFVYMFIYSGLEFTLTFLTHHVFHYTSMQQGWMFFAIGLIMAILQGGYVRRLPPNKVKPTAILGLSLIIPSFVFVAIARNIWVLCIGLFLFAVSTAMCVTCMTTMVAVYGSPKEKGTVMGIFRSLGALARAVGPIVACIAFWSLGSTFTYLIGATALIWPAYTLKTKV